MQVQIVFSSIVCFVDENYSLCVLNCIYAIGNNQIENEKGSHDELHMFAFLAYNQEIDILSELPASLALQHQGMRRVKTQSGRRY